MSLSWRELRPYMVTARGKKAEALVSKNSEKAWWLNVSMIFSTEEEAKKAAYQLLKEAEKLEGVK